MMGPATQVVLLPLLCTLPQHGASGEEEQNSKKRIWHY